MRSFIISIFFIAALSCQSNAQSTSTEKIKEGWELFFDEEFEQAKIHFEGLYRLDSNNLEIREGLFYSTSITENEVNIDIASKLFGDSKENISKCSVTAVKLLNYYSTPKTERIDPINSSVEEFKASRTDGFLKTNQAEGQFKNQKKIGLWKYNNLGGSLYKTINYSDSSNIHLVTYFNQNRKIKEELTRIEDRDGYTSHYVLRRVIYYQELPDKNAEYLFVSKEGFCVFDEYNPVRLDENTPNNVIEETVTLEGIKYSIWKDGNRIPYLEKKY